jgi:prolycopene isomerase
MSPEQLGDGRPGVSGPVRNLYLTGHWTRPGGGITPVLVSAMHAAEAVVNGAGAPAPTEREPALA